MLLALTSSLQPQYGWEPQLAELTFHALFLVPLLSMDPFFGWNGVDGPYPVPKLVVFAVRFYLFKIMLGAGLIKVKSRDMKWKPGNMSAMYYFYETQVRNLSVVSWFLDQLSVLLPCLTFATTLQCDLYYFSQYQTLSRGIFTQCLSDGTNLRCGETILLSWWLHSCC